MLSEFERKITEDCQSVLLNAIFSHMTIQVKKKESVGKHSFHSPIPLFELILNVTPKEIIMTCTGNIFL